MLFSSTDMLLLIQFQEILKDLGSGKLNEDCPIAEDIVSLKFNRVVSLKDLLSNVIVIS